MADQFSQRTFVGDPSPAPAFKRSDIPSFAPSASAPQEAPAALGLATPSEVAQTRELSGQEGEFWVSGADKDGRHFIYNTTPDGENHKIGFADGVEGVLNAVAPRHELTGSWRKLPKDFVMSLAKQEVGLQDHVFKMFEAGKAGTANGMIWWQAMSGQMGDEEALDRTEPELLKMQVDSAFKPWSDGRMASMASTVPWALGKAAQVLPSLMQGVGRGVELLPATALAATAAAAATGGPAGLAALATPAGVAGALGASSAAGMFDFTFKVTAGSVYGDLRRSDIDPKVAKSLAPVAGILAGSLEVVGFRFFTAAMRRTFANKVLGNEAVKAQMAKWYVNYLKETGAEAGIESAQEVVEEVTKNFAAAIEKRPELVKGPGDIAKIAAQAGIDAFVGFGILKIPGAVMEGAAARPTTAKAPAPAATATTTPAAQVEGVAPVMPAPIVTPAKTVEQELVSGTPEVAESLAQINTELDPTAPEARVVYEEMGTELMGDENAAAAVTAKVEALRSEMNEILVSEEYGDLSAEGEGVQALQARVSEIQNEIGLLESMRTRMEAEPEAAPTTKGKKVYHFSDTKIEQFEERGQGVWLTSNQYGVVRKRTSGAVRNDFFIDVDDLNLAGEKDYNQFWQLPAKERIVKMKELGYDGVKMRVEGDTHYLIFDAKNVRPTPAAKKPKPITGARARIQEKVVAARDKALASELDNTVAMIKELESARTRLEKAGRATKSIDNEITKLMADMYRIDAERGALAETGEVAKGAALEMKPATLESIQKMAFTEGRKEVVTRRASLINDVAVQHGLSDRDVKSLVKNRNLGVMSDFDFKKFIDNLRVEAPKLAEKKQAFIELETTKQMGEFKRADSLRKAMSLPPVSKMTTEQMRQYAAALEEFEAGDEFLTEKRAAALVGTPWEGAKTIREIVERMAEQFGVSPEALADVKSSWMNLFFYDAVLAAQNPLYDFVVRRAKAADLEGVAKFFEADAEFEALAQAALSSRKQEGVLAKIAEFLAPQQKVIRRYMEASDPKEKASIAAAMTPEEIAFADHEAAFLLRAYNYLLANNDLASSRFVETYVAYTKKPASEVLRGVAAGETGVLQAVKDILNSWRAEETRFSVVDDKGNQLGYRKFFSHTLFRSGEMKPSENVVRASRNYRRQFFRKQALDKMIPTVDTAVEALKASQKTPEGRDAMRAVHDFLKTYLNAQKGKVSFGWIPQGSVADGLIRAATQMVSLMYMGANVTLQVASEVGATIPKMPLLGVTGYVKAKYRKTTPQGKAILAKNKAFIGEGPLTDIMKPGMNIEERAMPALFALFAWSRKSMLEDVLLGSMTDAEFKAGEVDSSRLADIKLEASRWIDIGGMKSVFGRSSIGTAQMQYKSWAVPTTISLIKMAGKLAKTLATRKDALTAKDKLELFRVVYTASAIVAMHGIFDELKEEDSFLGRLAARAYMELTTSLTAGLEVGFFFSGPAALGWVVRLVDNLQIWVTAQRIKAGSNKGKLRGLENIKRQLTPSLIKQFLSDGRKPKKNRYAPAKFKREKDK